MVIQIYIINLDYWDCPNRKDNPNTKICENHNILNHKCAEENVILLRNFVKKRKLYYSIKPLKLLILFLVDP